MEMAQREMRANLVGNEDYLLARVGLELLCIKDHTVLGSSVRISGFVESKIWQGTQNVELSGTAASD